MAATTHLGITLVEQSQAQKEITVNEAFARIDAVLNTGAISQSVSTPPASPATGDVYIVGPSPGGDWTGKAGQIAYYDQLWRFIVPQKGMLMCVNDEDLLYNFDGAGWVTSISLGDSGPLTLTGDVTGSGTSIIATTISGGAVTAPMLAPSVIPFFGDGISGLTLSVNALDSLHDVDFAPGLCLSSSRTAMMQLTGTLTKQLDAPWSAGHNVGGRFSASLGASTSYHAFIIRKDADGSLDAGFDDNITAANIPTGYSAYRRIGSFYTDGSGNIVTFFQNGNRFILDVAVRDISASNPGTAAVTRTLSVPAGIEVDAILTLGISLGTSNNVNILATALKQTDTAPSGLIFSYRFFRVGADNIAIYSSHHEVETNSYGQIRTRQDASGVSDSFLAMTHGWVDRRAI